MFYADHQPRCPAGHYKVSVINLPSRSTTLTCRHTELIHLYYTQLKPKYQLEFRVISKGFAASSHIFQTPIRIQQELQKLSEYSCAVTPQVRQTGKRLSGLAGTAYASLLA